MSDEPIDISTLSDEEFMKLDPTQMQEVPAKVEDSPEEENENADDGNEALDSEGNDPDDVDGNDDKSEDTDPEAIEAENKQKPVDESDPIENESGSAPKEDGQKPVVKSAEPKAEAKPKKEEAPVKADSNVMADFYAKVTAPFKADGKDMQVRSPEDAVRLMQMGVNYSRRMGEMKPLRAQDQMLKQHGLNDPDKLNFLIDVSKGNKEAIKQLLKDHKIDPVDIDTSSEDKPYTATNYQGDPKDLEFDDAIKNTLAQEGGRELITDINKDWDPISKEALRDQPEIFENILAQKRSGVYEKIKTELNYQRTMGFLTQVPFLKAYHQVGEAMQKAGVFSPKTQPEVKKPLGTGIRKAAPRPKIEQPNPNISSASPPRSAPTNVGGQQKQKDYAVMSDAEFMKLAPP